MESGQCHFGFAYKEMEHICLVFEKDLKVLLSVKEFPIRIKCALLSCNAIDSALKNNFSTEN